MTISEESAICREWGRMRGFQNEMLGPIDEIFFLSGKGAPEQKDNTFALVRDGANDCVREYVPAEVSVGVRLAGADGKGSVQE